MESLKRLGHNVEINNPNAPVQLNFSQPVYFKLNENQYQISYTPWESTKIPDEWKPIMLKTLGASVQPWGIKITRIEIKDISPPADLIEAMAKQMKAEREKRAAILEAEGQKQSKILKAEGEKQSAILQSEGVRQATILQAEAKREAAFREAEGRERQAKAEAVATEMMSLVLEEGGNLHALNYFIAQRYLEALGQLAQSDNQKVMMLPMESTQILGSLGGIRELLDAAAASSTHHKKG
jgi:regulator of protease activity HflC (stomatin/prohibitin superfamily)